MADSQHEDHSRPGHVSVTMWPVVATFLVLFLLYAPLLAALLECKLFGTMHVYEFFDSIGLADPLDKIYTPTCELFLD